MTEWGCCWRTLLFGSPRRLDAQLFTYIRAWRSFALTRKHRRRVATAREWRQVHFFKVPLRSRAATPSSGVQTFSHSHTLCLLRAQCALVLHAAVVSLDHSGTDMNDAPFELVVFLSALFPDAAESLDASVRPRLSGESTDDKQQPTVESVSYSGDRRSSTRSSSSGGLRSSRGLSDGRFLS